MARNEIVTPTGQGTVPTGFRDLDRLAPFCAGDLIAVAARPGVGRFRFAMNLMKNVSAAGVPVLLFALECSRDFVVRCWAEDGGLSPLGVARAVIKMAESKFWCNDTAFTVAHIVEQAERWRSSIEAYSGALVVIDRFEVIGTGHIIPGPTRERSDFVAKALKKMAGELGVTVLVLSSVAMESERRPGHRPLIADLPACLADSAQVVAFLHRADAFDRKETPTNTAELEVAMQRNGPTGTIHLSCADLFFADFVAGDAGGVPHAR